MTSPALYAFIFAFNSIACLGLGLYAYFRNKELKNFLIFNLTIFFYSVFHLPFVALTSYHAVLITSKLLMLGITFLPYAYLNFCCEVAHSKLSSKFRIINTIALFLLFIAVFSNFIIRDVQPILNFLFWPRAGILFPLYLIFYGVNVVYGVALLIKQAKIDDKIWFIIIGSFLGFAGGGTNFLLFYNIPISPYGNILISLYAICKAPILCAS